jgi:flagellar motility protein MotE (MotC chaperone)
MLKRIRLLPILIFAAALMLSVRLGHLWQDFAIGVGQRTEAQSTGAGAPPAKPATTPAAAPQAQAQQGAAAPTTGNPAQTQPAATQPTTAQQTPPKDDAAQASLPIDFTDSEIGLLQSLAQRRDELDRKAKEMELREGLLKATEKRIDDKIAKLGELQASLQGLLKQYDAKTDAQLQSLVKTYGAMKPRDAARIWDQLDMPVLLQLVEHMQERKTAPILAAMSPETAKRITDELIRRRKLPGANG